MPRKYTKTTKIKKKPKPKGYWNFDRLREEALKYPTKAAFRKADYAAWQAALLRYDYELIVSHMPKRKYMKGENNYNFKWSFDRLLEEALKFKTKGEFVRGNFGAYSAALDSGRYEEIVAHMPEKVDTSGENSASFKWSYEKLKKEALKFNTLSEFINCSEKAYQAARKRSYYEEIVGHLEKSTISFPEKTIMEEVLKIFPGAKKHRITKLKIPGKPFIHRFECDVFVPSLMKGIEYDSTRYHSFEFMRADSKRSKWSDEDIRNYHEIKDEAFLSRGIQILHIKEEEWKRDEEKCLKRVLEFLSGK